MLNLNLIFIYVTVLIFFVLSFVLLLPPLNKKIKKFAGSEELATITSILILSAYVFILFGLGLKINSEKNVQFL
jgi:hypothetical protein